MNTGTVIDFHACHTVLYCFLISKFQIPVARSSSCSPTEQNRRSKLSFIFSASFFYRADDNACHKISLQERIDHQKRDSGYHNFSRIQRAGGDGHEINQLLSIGDLRDVYGQLLNVGLKRVFARCTHIDQALEIIVPMIYNAKQSHRGKSRL